MAKRFAMEVAGDGPSTADRARCRHQEVPTEIARGLEPEAPVEVASRARGLPCCPERWRVTKGEADETGGVMNGALSR